MKLTATQIEELFRFTARKYVRYYDLQVELVDHLASRIEEEMCISKISFEHALQKVYAEFGIFGFSKLVQEKERQVNRTGNRLLRKEVAGLFAWPKIMFTLFVAVLLWQLVQFVDMKILYPLAVIAWLATSIWFTTKAVRFRKQLKKPLLSVQLDAGLANGGVIFFEILFFTGRITDMSWIFLIIIVAGVFLKMASFRVYKNTVRNARQLYPAAFA